MYCKYKAKRKDCDLYLDKFRFLLLTDLNMLLLFEKNIEGRIPQALKRYINAVNQYIKYPYNADGTSVYLQYLDANIYVWA